MNGNLFDDADIPSRKAWIDVLPTSVVDVGRQAHSRRSTGGHDAASSRSEYSPFSAEACSLAYGLFLRDCTKVFDPFAGWGERGAAAVTAGIHYVGYDCSPSAISNAREEFGVTNELHDSVTVPIPYHDGLFTCPPYWNLETYGGEDAGIDKAGTWDAFLEDYAIILERCYDAAAVGATYVVVVGDWRKDHRYYDLGYQTSHIMDDLGATPVDEVILSRIKTSKIKIMVDQAVRLGYTVKVHEKMLVWQKR